MIDPSKVPSGLVVGQVWVPVDENDDRRPIAYAGDRRRRVAAMVLIASGVLIAMVGLVTGLGFGLAFVGLLIALAGVAWASGGRTGYYEVAQDGALGKYLGRAQPDLREMRTRAVK